MTLILKRKMQIFMWKLRLATICARYGAPKLALWVLVYIMEYKILIFVGVLAILSLSLKKRKIILEKIK